MSTISKLPSATPALGLRTVFRLPDQDTPQQILKRFQSANASLIASLSEKGGSLSAYNAKDGSSYVLVNPLKSPARLYKLGADGKAIAADEPSLSKLPRLYDDLADTNNGSLMAELRDRFYLLQHFPPQRPPGAPASDREVEMNAAIRFISAQGSKNVDALVSDSVDADSDPSKREKWQRDVETEIQDTVKTKRADLTKQINALEQDYDTASISLGGTN